MRLVTILGLGLGLVLSACGGGGPNEATTDYARNLSRSFRTLEKCALDTDNSGCQFDFSIYGTPTDLCLNVSAGSPVLRPSGVGAQRWEDVDWGRFEDICDDWERVGSMTVIQARPELIRLAQEAQKLGE